MKTKKKLLLFSVSLLAPVAIIAPIVTSCGCSGNADGFKDLLYGQQTPDINKDTKANAKSAAIQHFAAQFDPTEIGEKDGTIKVSDFEAEFSGYTITCTDLYWNLIYSFANKCGDNDVYQIVDWNGNEYDSTTINNEITLRDKEGNYTLIGDPTDNFEYSYNSDELDEKGYAEICITLALQSSTLMLPSYLAAQIRVIND